MNPAELAIWTRAKIEQARGGSPALVADNGRAFQVWGTIGSAGYVTVDREIYLETDTWDPSPGTFVVRRDENARCHVLYFAARRYPELATCLPTRMPTDPSCTECNGEGWKTILDHRIFCDACAGLGWIASAGNLLRP